MSASRITVLIVAYVVAAPLVMMAVRRWLGDGIWVKLIVLPETPATIVWLLLLWMGSIPYVWLYPERMAMVTDFRGSEEERKALAELRAVLRQKSLLRRLAEKLGLAPSSSPA